MSAISERSWFISIADSNQQIEVSPNPVFARVLSNLPSHIRSGLTAEQIAGLARASQPPRADHIVNYRTSLPFFGRQFYVAFLFGREKRSATRLGAEGQLRPWIKSIAILLFFWIVASMLTATGVVILYFIKSAAGIDLFAGPSVLHGLLFAA